MSYSEDHIDRLNRLLRGEISAVETYQQALEKITGPEASELRAMMDDHQQAAETWRERVIRYGGTPSDDSGIWGSWAQLVEGTAKVFGPGTALSALKQGEEHGIAEYERALDDEDVAAEDKTLIRSELLPRSQAHIQALDRLIAAA